MIAICNGRPSWDASCFISIGPGANVHHTESSKGEFLRRRAKHKFAWGRLGASMSSMLHGKYGRGSYNLKMARVLTN